MERTSFETLLGARYPVIQGPFGGGLSTVALAAAVADAGGLGSFGAHVLEPAQIEILVRELRSRTAGPFAINLWVSDHDPAAAQFSHDDFERTWQVFAPLYREYGLPEPEAPTLYHPRFDRQIEALLEAAPPAFSFVFGVPSAAILAECRRRGIVTLGTATTLAEGHALEAAGVDLVVASGCEAGGHRPSFLERAEASLIGTLPLTRILATHLRTPVIAAGGIVDGAGVRAALALGATAAQIGTAFLACRESGTNDVHREVLFGARAQRTVLTRAYTGRLARGVPNRLVEFMEAHADALPPFPVQAWFVARLKTAAMAAGHEDFLALYASQAAPLLRHRTAAELMNALVERTTSNHPQGEP